MDSERDWIYLQRFASIGRQPTGVVTGSSRPTADSHTRRAENSHDCPPYDVLVVISGANQSDSPLATAENLLLAATHFFAPRDSYGQSHKTKRQPGLPLLAGTSSGGRSHLGAEAVGIDLDKLTLDAFCKGHELTSGDSSIGVRADHRTWWGLRA